MSFKFIHGLNIIPTNENRTIGLPKIGSPQLEMLQSCGINSLDSLYSYINKIKKVGSEDPLDVSQPAKDGKFKVVTMEDLEFGKDHEHRLYENNITVRDTILDLSYLCLRDSVTVEFTNCMIIGDLNISMNSKTLRQVYLDRCLILGRICIYGVQSPDCKVEIVDSNCFILEVKNSEIKSLDISTCKVPKLLLCELSLDNISIIGNYVSHVRICNVSARAQRINHEQFDLKQIAKAPPKHDLQHLPSGFFNIIREISFGDTDREGLFQTISFLRQYTALESDRRAFNTVRLIASGRYQRTILGELAVRILGAVQSPFLILFAAMCVFLGMALTYHFLPLEFAQGMNTVRLDFPTACYFSGVTMMTVGYGDIVPLGMARYLAIIESVLGVTVWSVFVVALVRKYID